MSYILDALKKAEGERDRARVPTLSTVHSPARRIGRRIGFWALCGGLAVCAAVAIWLFQLPPSALSPPAREPLVPPAPARPASPPPAESAREPGRLPAPLPAPSPPASPAPPADDALEGPLAPHRRGPEGAARPHLALPRPAPPHGEARVASPPAPAEPSSRRQQPAASVTAPPPVTPPASGSGTPETPTPLERQPTPEATRPPANAPPPPAEAAAPPTLQEAMAKMTLNVLVYTEAEADRMVTINGKRYVKGDYIDGRYRVENITREGAVLSYQGERALLHP